MAQLKDTTINGNLTNTGRITVGTISSITSNTSGIILSEAVEIVAGAFSYGGASLLNTNEIYINVTPSADYTAGLHVTSYTKLIGTSNQADTVLSNLSNCSGIIFYNMNGNNNNHGIVSFIDNTTSFKVNNIGNTTGSLAFSKSGSNVSIKATTSGQYSLTVWYTEGIS